MLPDLAFSIEKYQEEKEQQPEMASVHFMQMTLLGYSQRPKGIKSKVISLFGNSHHLWMWDKASLIKELKDAGFKNIREVCFNDSDDKSFIEVEERSWFWGAIALEAIK